jgi:protein-S-isoprenylcysteine O-methyltransferase Ste14
MRRSRAAFGSAAFLVVAPGVAAGVVPWALTRWRVGGRWWPPAVAAGWVLVALGAIVVVGAFARFVLEGRGTPAPVAPTARLVVGGMYRYVRNPMYLAVLAIVIGQGLVLGRGWLLAYAAGLGLVFAAFVGWYEEPALRRRFGEPYEAYRRAVPGWLPRLHPWDPDGSNGPRAA